MLASVKIGILYTLSIRITPKPGPGLTVLVESHAEGLSLAGSWKDLRDRVGEVKRACEGTM